VSSVELVPASPYTHRDMPIALAVVVVVGIVSLGGFLMWFMFKALGVDLQWLKEDAERLVPGRRKLMWAGVVALPVSVAVGAVIGPSSAPLSDPLSTVT
jgi:hypothetical protein